MCSPVIALHHFRVLANLSGWAECLMLMPTRAVLMNQIGHRLHLQFRLIHCSTWTAAVILLTSLKSTASCTVITLNKTNGIDDTSFD